MTFLSKPFQVVDIGLERRMTNFTNEGVRGGEVFWVLLVCFKKKIISQTFDIESNNYSASLNNFLKTLLIPVSKVIYSCLPYTPPNKSRQPSLNEIGDIRTLWRILPSASLVISNLCCFALCSFFTTTLPTKVRSYSLLKTNLDDVGNLYQCHRGTSSPSLTQSLSLPSAASAISQCWR